MKKENSDLSLFEFVEYAAKISKGRIKVLPFEEVEEQGRYVVSEKGIQGHMRPAIPGEIVFLVTSAVLYCKTRYCSYDMADLVEDKFGRIIGRELETCEETHFRTEFSEEYESGGYNRYYPTEYTVRNTLTAYYRTIQLHNLLPEVHVSLEIPFGSGRYPRDKMLEDALANGLKPYPIYALGFGLYRKIRTS